MKETMGQYCLIKLTTDDLHTMSCYEYDKEYTIFGCDIRTNGKGIILSEEDLKDILTSNISQKTKSNLLKAIAIKEKK